ncbi:hypothetical protein [Oceanobacillus sp. J11TS1]|uniref:hypothetical protein n=1 Tax=Oceanobacillus sp. J11TS1 TaxID=2807191 RepID=UPI001B1B1C26|nr:hypothetical protein [Oceanobacillus sp. J11TS1]GIO25343.1 hypothetical protein J11TS1_39240 [Oceanobacillus sp. J11TS1]
MYIDRIKSKHKYYLYLRKYESSVTYSLDKRVLVFRFGREEHALAEMRAWLQDINLLPIELKKLGFTKEDVQEWINNVEERREKTISSKYINYHALSS